MSSAVSLLLQAGGAFLCGALGHSIVFSAFANRPDRVRLTSLRFAGETGDLSPQFEAAQVTKSSDSLPQATVSPCLPTNGLPPASSCSIAAAAAVPRPSESRASQSSPSPGLNGCAAPPRTPWGLTATTAYPPRLAQPAPSEATAASACTALRVAEAMTHTQAERLPNGELLLLHSRRILAPNPQHEPLQDPRHFVLLEKWGRVPSSSLLGVLCRALLGPVAAGAALAPRGFEVVESVDFVFDSQQEKPVLKTCFESIRAR
eukprot:GHVT01046787.1.p1 GENE.GHVT01046787.1~~GHVT01046787.1.p1  ORF type:complete len:261 (-),score=48.08 GHVT01046787.1:1182-1964(-)